MDPYIAPAHARLDDVCLGVNNELRLPPSGSGLVAGRSGGMGGRELLLDLERQRDLILVGEAHIGGNRQHLLVLEPHVLEHEQNVIVGQLLGDGHQHLHKGGIELHEASTLEHHGKVAAIEQAGGANLCAQCIHARVVDVRLGHHVHVVAGVALGEEQWIRPFSQS